MSAQLIKENKNIYACLLLPYRVVLSLRLINTPNPVLTRITNVHHFFFVAPVTEKLFVNGN